ncbi:hypothetical protein NL676_022396 [Syzygium grande]|nr:hypothetical protein NL676_022396 [Syzygium grande]
MHCLSRDLFSALIQRARHGEEAVPVDSYQALKRSAVRQQPASLNAVMKKVSVLITSAIVLQAANVLRLTTLSDALAPAIKIACKSAITSNSR